MQTALVQTFHERITGYAPLVAYMAALTQPITKKPDVIRLYHARAERDPLFPYIVYTFRLTRQWGCMYEGPILFDVWDYNPKTLRVFQIQELLKAALIGWQIPDHADFMAGRLFFPDDLPELVDTGAEDVHRLPWSCTFRVWDEQASRNMIANHEG